MLAVVTNDYHVPFHTPSVVALATQLIKALKPDVHAIIGDFYDTYPISDFTKRPFSHGTLDTEVEVGAKIHHEQTPHAKKTYLLGGNHEFRITKWIWSAEGFFSKLGDAAEEAMKLLHPRKLFKLDRHGIVWMDYGKPLFLGDLMLRHGEVAGTHTAATNLRKFRRSVITGHNHRREMKAHSSDGMPDIESWTNGCLCTLEPEYARGPVDWQHCMAVVDYDKKGPFNVQQLPVRWDKAGNPYVRMGRDVIK